MTSNRRNKSLRIAMLSIHSSPIGPLGSRDTGGMSVFIRELAKEMGFRGHRVDIFTRRQTPEAPDEIDLSPRVRLVHLQMGKTLPIPKLSLYSLAGEGFEALESYRAGKSRQYDLIHSHYWLSGQLGHRAKTRWGIPHVTTFHTLGRVKNKADQTKPEPDVRIRSESQLVSNCDRLLVPTHRERTFLAKYYRAPDRKIGLVPCGVNLDLFQPKGRTASRRRLGLDSKACLLLFVGRFEAMKGLDILIRAMGMLRHRHRLQLLVVGGDGDGAPETIRFRELAGTEGVQDRVTFTGRRDQSVLPWYYSAADALVMPSRYESFGMVALESLACGTAVVATRVGVMETVINGLGNGCLAQDREATSLATAIEAVLDRSDPMPDHAIRETVLSLSWKRAADQLLDEYGEALGEKRSEQ